MPAFITPEKLRALFPITGAITQTVKKTRDDLVRLLQQRDDRLVVIVGPCSIHHAEFAYRYAEKLKKLIEKHDKNLCIVMRVYIEKTRTAMGWKGLVNDPDLNNTFDIEKGLKTARHVLLAINQLGVPIGTEIVNPMVAHYFSDLSSWAVVGARTTESQLHRELASDLPMPIAFKNNTSGDIQVALDAIQTASQPHHFLSVDLTGKIAVTHSLGNPYTHLVLRGAKSHTNYDVHTLTQTTALLKKHGLLHHILIDCSHGNSQKNHLQQLVVIQELSDRIKQGDSHFLGVMIESYLRAGKQAWSPTQSLLGDLSITDACIGWEDTEMVLDTLSEAVQMRRIMLNYKT